MKKTRLHIVSEPTYSKKVKNKVCIVYGCTKKAGNNGRFKHCYKHHRENQKYNNPLRYYYDMLRQNAKTRKKEFTLTIDEFKIFCEDTDYLTLKGRGANNLTIDRINQDKGYSKDNIQILTGKNNSRKYWVDLKIRFGYYPTDEEIEELFRGDITNVGLRDIIIENNKGSDCPF